MQVMVIGKGGREHAIVKALSLSPQKPQIFALPGNPGMEKLATCLAGGMDLENVLSHCEQASIDLVIIGPEDPLVAGLADGLRAKGIAVFGPSGTAAQLEGSKVFAKDFMLRHNIPTAKSQVVQSLEDVSFHAASFTPPYVLKADGLAGGKGVYICDSLDELKAAADDIFNQKILGDAGRIALLEQFQPGYELSFFVLTNGDSFEALPMAQDHKKLCDGDLGPNTGGMGTVAPMEVSPSLYDQILQSVVVPTVNGLKKEDLYYRGVVFIGLMITDQGPQVLEYNVRFGDPETQVILPLLEGDWLEVFKQVAQGHIQPMKWDSERAAACVVLAAQNYPKNPVNGVPILGDWREDPQQYFLHAGTAQKEGELVTAGGRVLNAIGTGATLNQAIERAYRQSQQVSWPKMQKRLDIGKKAL
jgi:phosphoribosylamine---glycine ligase